jgi:hypothetical protein
MKDEDRWKSNMRDGNYIYIFSGGNDRPYVLTAIRKDIKWTDYRGSRSPERVGIEVGGTRIINIYHHREQRLDSTNIMEEIQRNGQRNGYSPGILTVITASGMDMEENQQEIGAR